MGFSGTLVALTFAGVPPTKIDHSRLKDWLALGPALTLPFFFSLFYMTVLDTPSHLALPIYLLAKLNLILWPLISWRIILREPEPRKDELRLTLRDLGWALLTGGSIALAILVFAYLPPVGQMLENSVPAILDRLNNLNVTRESFWIFAIYLVFIHSVLEEFYWRRFVFSELSNRVGNSFAHLAAGIGFASHHMVITGTLFGWAWGLFMGATIGVGGVIWAVLYRRTKSILAAYVSHALADAAVVIVALDLLVPH